MHMVLSILAFSIAQAIAKDVPSNLAAFLIKVKADGPCNDPFPGSFYDIEGGSKSFRYCKGDGIIYLKGPSDKLANMDVDCDGLKNSLCPVPAGSDTQYHTSFEDSVRSRYGISDLDASIHNYVVFGNADDNHDTPGYTTFRPQDHGVQPSSLMAVVCDDQLLYGIWGDENGSDGPPLVGEASISLARLCFGDSMTNDNGHGPADVLYIAFTGQNAVPGGDGAAWKAKTSTEFQNHPAFNDLGDSLVKQIHV